MSHGTGCPPAPDQPAAGSDMELVPQPETDGAQRFGFNHNLEGRKENSSNLMLFSDLSVAWSQM